MSRCPYCQWVQLEPVDGYPVDHMICRYILQSWKFWKSPLGRRIRGRT